MLSCCPLGLLDNGESVTANNVTGSTQTIRVKEKVAVGREGEGMTKEKEIEVVRENRGGGLLKHRYTTKSRGDNFALYVRVYVCMVV